MPAAVNLPNVRPLTAKAECSDRNRLRAVNSSAAGRSGMNFGFSRICVWVLTLKQRGGIILYIR